MIFGCSLFGFVIGSPHLRTENDRGLHGDANQKEHPEVILQHLEIDGGEQCPGKDRPKHDRANTELPTRVKAGEQECGNGDCPDECRPEIDACVGRVGNVNHRGDEEHDRNRQQLQNDAKTDLLLGRLVFYSLTGGIFGHEAIQRDPKEVG